MSTLDPRTTPPSPPEGTAAAGQAGDRAPTVVAAALLLVISGAAIFAAGLSLGSARVGRDAQEQAAIAAFAEAYRDITRDYVGEADPDELLQAAIRGMFETLDDPYSAYLGPEEFDSTFSDIRGRFEGIGARMSVEDGAGQACPAIDAACRLRVIEVLPGSPALAAGLQAGDVVTAVDGAALAGRSLEDAVELIRGPRDSSVRLSLLRDDDSVDLDITRSVIVSQDVRSALLEEGRVGYLRVDSFSSSVADSFETALRESLEAGVEGLVVDLRDDPGGFVDAAVAISSQFIGEGPVYWEEDADGTQRAVGVSGEGLATDPALGLVVLVNGGTASASEILAGALQDAGRAELVGQPTFGKGTVQEWTSLPGESGGFRLSVAKWLTRDKRWIHEVGLIPDEIVDDGTDRFWPPLGATEVDEVTAAADEQLQRAIARLLDEPNGTGPGTSPAPSTSPAAPGAARSPGPVGRGSAPPAPRPGTAAPASDPES